MKQILYGAIALFWLAVQAILLWSAFLSAKGIKYWTPATGKIQATREEPIGDSLTTYPKISYEFLGNSYSQFYRGISVEGHYEIGDDIKIKINPQNPEEFVLDDISNCIFPIVIVVVIDFFTIPLALHWLVGK